MQKKLLTTLAVSVLTAMSQTSFASDSQSKEIEQLRQEVRELRALIEASQINTANPVIAQTAPVVPTVASAPKKVFAPNLDVKVYGNVRADASYQAEGSAADRPYNNMNKVPLEGINEASDRLKSTLSATRLGMDVKTQVDGQDASAKIEVDFLGGAGFDNLRVRHAYFNYANWLIGQTWSNFAIPDYMPETIDALGYVGGAVKRTPQVRYQHAFAPSTALLVALEDPKDGASKMRTPALTARLNHQINDDGRVSLRTMLNEKRSNHDKTTAWGVGLGLQYKLTPTTTFKSDYYHVKGDSSFVSWTNPGFSQNPQGEIFDKNEFDSITAGITQQFHPQWRGTLGFGYMKADVSDKYKAGFSEAAQLEINDDLWQVWVNLFYSPIKPISLGLEYIYGERDAIKDANNISRTGEDNRVNAVAMYNF